VLKKRTRPTTKNHGYVNGIAVADPIRRAKPGDPDYLTFDEAERLEKAYKAQEAELRIRQIEGSLVERAVAEKAIFESHRRVRDGMQNVAARISGILAAESGLPQARCFAIVNAEILQVLEALSK
jgi:hypothetical protein